MEQSEDDILKAGDYHSEVFGTRIMYIFYLSHSLSKLVEKTRFGTRVTLRENYILKLVPGRRAGLAEGRLSVFMP